MEKGAWKEALGITVTVHCLYSLMALFPWLLPFARQFGIASGKQAPKPLDALYGYCSSLANEAKRGGERWIKRCR